MAETSRPKSDFTMKSRRWSDERLVTAEIAIQLARSIHKSTFGVADLAANEPLAATASGDVWVVRGVKEVDPAQFLAKPDGPLVMRISQYDAQIVSYYFEMPSSDK